MPLTAAKAFFEVRAGIIPGQTMEEFTKTWTYTSEDYQKDIKTPKDQETIFTARLKEAYSYAMGITDPSALNWVRVDWIWV